MKKKRKVVGARSAKTGKFVPEEELEQNPDTTVAVTREVRQDPRRQHVEDKRERRPV